MGVPSRFRFSTFRRSRFCTYETCSVFRCPFVPYRVHYPLYIEESIGVSNFTIPYVCATGLELRFFRCRHFRYGLTDGGCHHTGTRVRQLASFTMHTGLAEQSHTYLLKSSAFPTCYFSLGVSTPGRLGVLEVLLSPSPALRRNFICTDTAHSPIHAIILHPLMV